MRESFVINILRQENSSWQGTMTQVGENQTRSFCSMLELIRLIDVSLNNVSNLDWKEASDQIPEL